MRRFMQRSMSVMTAVAIAAALTVFGVSDGSAQEKRKFARKDPAANTKYTQQYVIDAGDVPGHRVRILELRRTYPTDPPAYEGVPVIESWVRGFSDYTDLNGHAWGYFQDVLENGDKVFGRWDGTTQTTINSDGSKRTTFTGVGTLTGGTGKFRGIRGTSRDTAIFDPQTGYNEFQTEGEYWLE